jgi:hypothetical protein
MQGWFLSLLIPLIWLPLSCALRLMRFCLRGVLQFVIIKPIVAVIDIIMIATDNKSKLGYEIFVFIVYNIRSTHTPSYSLFS